MITRESLGLGTTYEAPAGELEKLIAGAFADVFELDRVGANDEFFDIGGDLLRGEVLSGLISEKAKRDFQISDLIEHTTPRRIAEFLSRKPNQPTDGAADPRSLLFMGGSVTPSPSPSSGKLLPRGKSYSYSSCPEFEGDKASTGPRTLPPSMSRSLSSTIRKGPVLIASFCVGALIALEMASQLAARDRPVAQLVLLDPSLPENRPVNVKREIKKKARMKGREPSKLWVSAQMLFHRLGTIARSL